jgi:hypothetical protein
VITTIAGAIASVQAIEDMHLEEMQVKSIQEYHKLIKK